MRAKRFIKLAAGHVSVICSIALLVIQILDWYNPFMDFMGHSMFLLYLLCISASILAAFELYGKTPSTEKFKNPLNKLS